MLMALLNKPFIKLKDCGIIKDNFKEIKNKLLNLKNDYDLIVISGGASVGHKDFLIKIIKEVGKIIFSKVAIKPGRPLSFGLIKNVPILILPGNPVASFVTFNLFGKFILNCLNGNLKKKPTFFSVKSNFNMKKKIGREEYLRGKLIKKNNELYVNKYNTEGAGILSSVVWSEGLIKLELNTQTIKVNDKLQFFPYEN
jgi:molybdopterin molybdotransferase